jgi:hypothetical protein
MFLIRGKRKVGKQCISGSQGRKGLGGLGERCLTRVKDAVHYAGHKGCTVELSIFC